MRASDLMQPDPLTLAPATPFLEIVRLFVQGHISGAPVVDEQGTVLGVISMTDLLRAVDQACDEDIDVEPTPAESSSLAARPPELPERLDVLSAIELASPDVVWVSLDTPLAAVAHLMRSSGIHRVLVGDAGRLAGLLTAFDLLGAIER